MIAAFMLITALPLVVLSFSVGWYATRQSEAIILEAAAQEIAQVDKTLELFIEDMKEDVRELADQAVFTDVDDSVTAYGDKRGGDDGRVPMAVKTDESSEALIYRKFAWFKTFHSRVDIMSYGVESNGGYVQFPATTRLPGFDPRTRPWYKLALDRPGEVAVTDPYLSANKEATGMISFVKSIEDGAGRLKGVVAVDVTLQNLSNIISGYRLSGKGFVMLTDANGVVMAHPHEREWIMQPVGKYYPGHLEDLAAVRAKTVETGGERPVILTVYTSPRTGWRIIGVIDKAEIMAEAARMQRGILLFALVIMALATAWALLISQRITEPIWKVVAAAKGIAGGDLAAPVKLDLHSIGTATRKDEIGVLAESVSAMARAIEKNFRDAEEYYRQNREHDWLVAEQLKRVDKLKDDFLAVVSHELKTPLHGIIGLAESSRERVSRTRNRALDANLELIASSGKRLANLVNDILDFTTLRNDQMRLKLGPVRLAELVRRVVTLERARLGAGRVKITVDVPEDLPPLYADGDRVAQILYNLIDNAVKFTADGAITVAAEARGGRMRVAVSDTGIGIPAAKLQAIFDPFAQVEAGGRGGAGLGLSIVKQLVELQGGEITVVSEPGQGSAFTFTLPVLDDRAQAAAPPGPAAADAAWTMPEIAAGGEELKPAARRPMVAGKRILAVDDDRVNLSVIGNYLAGTDYGFTLVASGEEALAELGRSRYDLVLLDMMMPGLSGLDVCREIRARYGGTAIPVLMLTVRNQPEDKVAAFRAGASDFITKPFHKKELLARIEAHLGLLSAHQAEMRALQAQIRPHFFYNAINTIAIQCRSNPEMARELLVALGTYLQGCFNFQEEFVSLAKEMALVDAYLAIEKARLGDRLRVVVDVEPCRDCELPLLTLQPLVENAVQHGIFPKRGTGTVTITCRREAGFLVFSVSDDGVGMSPERLAEIFAPDEKSRGVGVVNVDGRLRRLYGSGLDVSSEEDAGTSVSFRLPAPAGRMEAH